jgi:hypothetical protein
MSDDERVSLAHVVHRLKQLHGPRLTAYWLYHQARALTLEADRQAMGRSVPAGTEVVPAGTTSVKAEANENRSA